MNLFLSQQLGHPKKKSTKRATRSIACAFEPAALNYSYVVQVPETSEVSTQVPTPPDVPELPLPPTPVEAVPTPPAPEDLPVAPPVVEQEIPQIEVLPLHMVLK